MAVKPFLDSVKVVVEAPLKPSEEPEKVAAAVRNIAGGLGITSIERRGDTLVAETEDQRALYYLYEQLRSRRSIGVARRLLLHNASEASSWIYLNKQAAYVKVVNICEDESESPLGPLKMTIRCRDLSKFIDWIAPEKPE